MQDYNIENPVDTAINYTHFVTVKLHEHSQTVQDEEAKPIYDLFTRIYAGIGIMLSSGYDEIKALDTFIQAHIKENQLIEKVLMRMLKNKPDNTSDTHLS